MRLFRIKGKKGQEDGHLAPHDHHAVIEVTALTMGLTILVALALLIYILLNYVRSQ